MNMSMVQYMMQYIASGWMLVGHHYAGVEFAIENYD